MRLFLISVITICLNQLIYGQLSFDEEAAVVGLNTTCGTTYLGNGISFVDYNNDGWDDVTLTTATGISLRFFKNTNGTFSEEFLNIPNTAFEQKQVNWVDIDNDGDKDLFVTSVTDGNRLFENDGSLNFQDITVSSGLPTNNMFTYGASWGDVNNDGYLDVYISNRDITFIHTNKLYLNNGNNTFTDITNSAGVGIAQLSFCSVFFDYNNDGYQDIYISNDKYYTQNYLFKNNGDNTFDDVSQLSETDCESLGWGAVFLDADNDMDLDLYVSGSLDGSNPGLISAAMYENIGVDSFAIPENAGFGDDVGESYSNAIGDVNNDGLPEIVVSNSSNQDLFLWSNKSTPTNNWLKIRLEGTESNRDGIGSKIEISVNGTKQYRYTHCGEGYLSQNSNTEFFGLETNTLVDYVKVNWLSGTEDIFYNVSANQVLEILEGSETLGISQNEAPDVHISPNPFHSELLIKTSDVIQHYEIFDVYGKLVLQSTFQPDLKIVNLSSLNSGIYFLKLIATHGITVRKLIKK